MAAADSAGFEATKPRVDAASPWYYANNSSHLEFLQVSEKSAVCPTSHSVENEEGSSEALETEIQAVGEIVRQGRRRERHETLATIREFTTLWWVVAR